MKLTVMAECTNAKPPTFEVTVALDAGSKTSSSNDFAKVFRAVVHATEPAKVPYITVSRRDMSVSAAYRPSRSITTEVIRAVLDVMEEL